MHTSLLYSFRSLVEADPDALAVRDSGGGCTRAELLELAQRFRSRLPETPRVVFAEVTNDRSTIALFLACLETGAALLPVDRGASPESVERIHRELKPDLVFDVAAGTCNTTGHEPTETIRGHCLLKLTSGSEAAPRVVLVSEAALQADGHAILDAMGIRPEDRNYGVIPVAHSYGFGNLVLPLLMQGTAVGLESDFEPSRLVEQIVTTGATVFPGVPFMFSWLARHLESLPKSIRLCISAGSVLNPEDAQAFHRRFGRKVHSFYGSSETGGITYDTSEDPEDISVGRPMPKVTVSVEPGEQGPRVVVQGPAVATGTLSAGSGVVPFSENRFVTGDLGRFTDDGRLILTGRVGQLIHVAGRKVHPAEVEGALRLIEGVSDAVVVGVEGAARGEDIVAFVVGDVSPVALRKGCAERLPSWKVPRDFRQVDAIPRTDRGKIDHAQLRALLRQIP